MFLTLEIFLHHFLDIDISKEEFPRNLYVMYKKPVTLAQIVNGETSLTKKDSDIRLTQRDRILEYFYEILVRNRDKYLSKFFQSYFQFKNPRTLDWQTDNDKHKLEGPRLDDGGGQLSVQRNDASRRIIRNLYYLELLDYTEISNTVKSEVSFWQSFTNMYNHLRLEDRFCAPSSIDLFLRQKNRKYNRDEINYNNLYYLFQAYQPKASIFNPYSITWILDQLVPRYLQIDNQYNLSLFSPVLSWSSYMVAFMESMRYSHYTGIDVMPSVCQKSNFLGNHYINNWLPESGPAKTFQIIQSPSEKLANNMQFMAQCKNQHQVVIICPPYYDMEIYKGGEQSIESYPTYSEWLEKYWWPTVQLSYEVLQPGGLFLLICNNYYSLDKTYYTLVNDFDHYVSQLFGNYLDFFYLKNRTSPLRANSKDRTERLIIYRKS